MGYNKIPRNKSITFPKEVSQQHQKPYFRKSAHIRQGKTTNTLRGQNHCPQRVKIHQQNSGTALHKEHLPNRDPYRATAICFLKNTRSALPSAVTRTAAAIASGIPEAVTVAIISPHTASKATSLAAAY